MILSDRVSQRQQTAAHRAVRAVNCCVREQLSEQTEDMISVFLKKQNPKLKEPVC